MNANWLSNPATALVPGLWGACFGAKLVHASADQATDTWKFPLEDKARFDTRDVTPQALCMIGTLMGGVVPTDNPHSYRGSMATSLRNGHGLLVSGDNNGAHGNDPHPKFGKPIAYGADLETQGAAAIRLELKDSGMVIERLVTRFTDALIVGEDTPFFDVAAGDGPMHRYIAVSAKSQTGWRPVGQMEVFLREGVFGKWELECHLLAAWEFSADITRIWRSTWVPRRVLYGSQELVMHENSIPAQWQVAVTGQEAKGKKVVAETTTSVSGTKHTSGRAVIFVE